MILFRLFCISKTPFYPVLKGAHHSEEAYVPLVSRSFAKINNILRLINTSISSLPGKGLEPAEV